MRTTIHSLHAPLWIEAVREARALADALHAAFRRWQTQRATRLALGALDDRLLHDLGLDRSDIASIALQPADTDRLLTWRSSW